MASVQVAAGWFRAKTWGGQAQGRPPPPQASLGQRAPPLRYQARFTGSLGSGGGNWKSSLPPRGPSVFLWTPLHSRSPTDAEAECPGKTWGLGAGVGGRPSSHARWSKPGGAGPTPMDGFSRGDTFCAPPVRLRVLLSLKLPHPAARWQTWTQHLQLAKVWAKLCEKGL